MIIGSVPIPICLYRLSPTREMPECDFRCIILDLFNDDLFSGGAAIVYDLDSDHPRVVIVSRNKLYLLHQYVLVQYEVFPADWTALEISQQLGAGDVVLYSSP